jgi:hypothetical protein
VNKVLNYTYFFYTVAAIGLLAAVILAVFFRDQSRRDGGGVAGSQ